MLKTLQKITVEAGKVQAANKDSMPVFFGIILCAAFVLDISEVVMLLSGTVIFGVLTAKHKLVRKSGNSVKCPIAQKACGKKPVYRTQSEMPVVAPTFESTGWDEEVRELTKQLVPTPNSEALVKRLVEHVQQAISPLLPDAKVEGFASGNPGSKKAFGVAVPDFHIVASIKPSMLEENLAKDGVAPRDLRRLQKSATRTCTELIVANGGLKFRRSAFRGDEPKVTLLAPTSLGMSDSATAVDFSINCETPFHYARLLRACEECHPLAKELVLVVRRWARDRGICHAAKGHLAPYSWGLLVYYFLQVGISDENSRFPPFQADTTQRFRVPGGPDWSTGSLFKAFVAFYTSEFKWGSETLSVRLGRRGPSSRLKRKQVVLVEDPFDTTRNAANSLTTDGLVRLKEELRRAHEVCSGPDTSLTKLLEPWVPPERGTNEDSESSDVSAKVKG